MWSPSPREAQTTMPCKSCNRAVKVARSCNMVYIICPHCQQKFELQEYLSLMDDAMEKFMENIYCDRV